MDGFPLSRIWLEGYTHTGILGIPEGANISVMSSFVFVFVFVCWWYECTVLWWWRWSYTWHRSGCVVTKEEGKVVKAIRRTPGLQCSLPSLQHQNLARVLPERNWIGAYKLATVFFLSGLFQCTQYFLITKWKFEFRVLNTCQAPMGPENPYFLHPLLHVFTPIPRVHLYRGSTTRQPHILC